MNTFTEGLRQAWELLLRLDPAVLEVVGLTARVTLSAMLLSILLAVPLGALIALNRFRGKRLLMAVIYTGMGLPPVVVGLVVYLLLSRSGVWGAWGWLFTPRAMIFAQVIIATPVVLGVTLSSILSVDPQLKMQLRALGASPLQTARSILGEAWGGILVGCVAGYGRIVAEVGAVILVGGNIDGKTRVLTTAIVLETRRGNFDLALALGIILLGISFTLNLLLVAMQRRVEVAA